MRIRLSTACDSGCRGAAASPARVFVAWVVSLLVATAGLAQTTITLPDNRYALAADIRLGQEAAAEVRRQLPMLDDDVVDDYVEDIGQRLVAAIPPEFWHAGFRYSFDVVNQREINAFALPGGPMFLNRGMIEAARTEGEMAGVMAHEISHVALRHGTAQATRGQKWQIGAIAGQILGAIIGGTAGTVLSQGAQIGAGLKLMSYSREFERQADLLGAQILARAGYDPREMANLFRTIERESGSGGPEWLSSHPNPGNRDNAIVAEARSLRVQGNANTGQFQSVQARLRGMDPAWTAEQSARGEARGRTAGTAGVRTVRVPPPSRAYRISNPGDFLSVRVSVRVPSNWDEIRGTGAVTYAPEGGYFETGRRDYAFTHGVQIGVAPGRGQRLQADTERLIQAFARGNPRLRRQTGYQRDTIGGRGGLTTQLSNVSEVTGQAETVVLSTTYLRDGGLLFVIGVAPQREIGAYAEVFRNVRHSLRLTD
jgi:Zn-dependent protease with chaperone function